MIAAGDFKYVFGADIDADHPHGDLDRILIDGNVMPYREGESFYSIRSEDIAVLAESYAARNVICETPLLGEGWYYQGGTSSIVLRREIVNTIIRAHNEMMSTASGIFLWAANVNIPIGDVKHRQTDTESPNQISTIWPDIFWKPHSKFPIPEITDHVMSGSVIERLFIGVGWYFKYAVTAWHENAAGWTETQPTFSDDVHGLQPDHSSFVGRGFVRAYDCYAVKNDSNQFMWYATTVSGGAITVDFNRDSFGIKLNPRYVKRVLPIYTVYFDYYTDGGASNHGTSIIIGKTWKTLDAGGRVTLNPSADIVDGDQWSAYGKPEHKTPPSPSSTTANPWQSRDYTQVTKIRFFIEFADDISAI